MLLFADEMSSSVLSPCLFIMPLGKWLFFAKADGIDALRFRAKVNKVIFGTVGPAFTKCKVVLIGTSFVTMTLNCDFL